MKVWSKIKYEKAYAFRIADRAVRLVKARLAAEQYQVEKVEVLSVPHRDQPLTIKITLEIGAPVGVHTSMVIWQQVHGLFHANQTVCARTKDTTFHVTLTWDNDRESRLTKQLLRYLRREKALHHYRDIGPALGEVVGNVVDRAVRRGDISRERATALRYDRWGLQ